MQLPTSAVLTFLAGALALPSSVYDESGLSTRDSDLTFDLEGPCGKFIKKPVCCRTSVVGLVGIGCHAAPSGINTGVELAAECAKQKKFPSCCALGLLGLYGPCKAPFSVAAEQGYDGDETEHYSAPMVEVD